ncbi:MAG: cofactor assembly of complex C subunit B [Cyanobacteria bacterium P01_A01_bin.105]
MATPVLSSTFFLTLLLAVGLFFFIRAATKDRTKVAEFRADQSPETLRLTVLQYLMQRAYQPIKPAAATDSQAEATSGTEADWLQLRGQVRPSLLLAVFLGGLAAVGALCLGLVLAILFPEHAQWFLGVLAIAPLAAIFYWQRAGREEFVAFKVTGVSDPEQSALTFKGHRDEIIQMAANLPLVQQGK